MNKKEEFKRGEMMFKDKLSLVPHLPGSYQMKNKDGIIS